MSEAKHTPLPWAAVTPCSGECCWHVVEAAKVTPETTWEDWVNVPEMSEADAKLIVQCCNAHDDLVAALQTYVKYDEYINGPEGDAFTDRLQVARAALTKAGAALDDAQPEQQEQSK